MCRLETLHKYRTLISSLHYYFHRANQSSLHRFPVFQAGITMANMQHVNKIPTIRGTDVMRNPKLNKVIVLGNAPILTLALFLTFTLGRFIVRN